MPSSVVVAVIAVAELIPHSPSVHVEFCEAHVSVHDSFADDPRTHTNSDDRGDELGGQETSWVLSVLPVH